MYITSLDNVSGLLPPYITILFPLNDERVKKEHGAGRLPVTCGVIHFPINRKIVTLIIIGITTK